VSENPSEDRLDYLFNLFLEMGAIELYGVSEETGEPVYRVTSDCEHLFPELWKMQLADVGETANTLWQKGLIEINLTPKGESVYFREHNYRKYLELKHLLSQEERAFIQVFLDEM
jgi:hypothetical protein